MQVIADLHLWEVLHIRAHLECDGLAALGILHRDLALGLIDGYDLNGGCDRTLHLNGRWWLGSARDDPR